MVTCRDHVIGLVTMILQDSCSVYKDLVERRELTGVDQKVRYSGKQGLQAVQDLDIFGTEDVLFLSSSLRVL